MTKCAAWCNSYKAMSNLVMSLSRIPAVLGLKLTLKVAISQRIQPSDFFRDPLTDHQKILKVIFKKVIKNIVVEC